jgi:hypothetical protein
MQVLRQAGRQSEDVHNRLFASPGEVPTSTIVERTERERLGGGLTVIRDESVIAYVPGIVMGYQGGRDRNGLAVKRKNKDKMDDLTIYHHHQQQQQGLNN